MARHVGRPTNEEVASRKRKKLAKIIVPVSIILVLIVLVSTKELTGIMGNSVTMYESAYLLGDLNNDGNIDSMDLDILTNYVNNPTNEQYKLNEYQKAAANVYIDDSNNVNNEDLVALEAYVNSKNSLASSGTSFYSEIGTKYVCPSQYEITSDNKCKISKDASDQNDVNYSGSVKPKDDVDGKNEDASLQNESVQKQVSVDNKMEISAIDIPSNEKIYESNEELEFKLKFTTQGSQQYYYKTRTYYNYNANTKSADQNYEGDCIAVANDTIKKVSLKMSVSNRYFTTTIYTDKDCKNNYKLNEKNIEYVSPVYKSKQKTADVAINTVTKELDKNITLKISEPNSKIVEKGTKQKFQLKFLINDGKEYYYIWQVYKNDHLAQKSECKKVVNGMRPWHNVEMAGDKIYATVIMYNDNKCKSKIKSVNSSIYKIKTTNSNGDSKSKNDTVSNNGNKNSTSQKTNSGNEDTDKSSSKKSKKTISPTKKYSCPEGYLLYEPEGNEYVHMCYKPIEEAAKYELVYTCPKGYTKVKSGESDSTAYCQKMVKASSRVVNTYCKTGYEKIGGATCKRTLEPSVSYTCPKGYTKVKSGESDSTAYCQKKVKASSKVVNTYCKPGYEKIGGATCKMTFSPSVSYTCPKGYTKKKSGQSDSTAYCQKTVNATKEKYVSNTYCKSGYTKIGGAYCEKRVAATKIPGTTNQYKCDSGKLSGKTCIQTTKLLNEYGTRYKCKKGSLSRTKCLINSSIKAEKKCPSGSTISNGKCVKYDKLKEKKAPYCKNGSLSGDKKNCLINVSIKDKKKCPKGYKIDEGKCVKYSDLEEETTPYCPEGTLSEDNKKCLLDTTQTIGEKRYYCSEGAKLSGTSCLSPDTSTGGSYATLKYECPKGYKKSGKGLSTTCTKTN